MIMRNIVLCVTLFCLASLFLGVPFAEAHRGTQDALEKLDEAKDDLINAYDERDKWKGRYEGAYEAVKTLLAEWSSNEQSIKDNTYDVANTVAATVISVILEAVLTSDPGDGSAVKGEWFKELAEHLPTLLTAINAGKETADLFGDLNARESYLLALNTAVGALSEVISKNQVAFSTYESKYDIYVEKMQNHGGGLIRVPDHSTSGNYNSVTPLSLETIKTDVKDKNAYNSDDKKNMLKFWYHVNNLKGTSHPSSKSFKRFKDFDTFWKRNELPSNQLCGGDCRQQFQTPVEHLVICPHALPQDAQIPHGKVAPAGCNRAYYTCKKSDTNEHRVRLCSKRKKDDFLCNEPYRNCSNSKFQHKYMKTKHSDAAWGFKYGPLLGIYDATPGSSHTAELTTPAAYDWVKWYVASPGESGRGSLIETDNGDGTTTTASMTYTFPQSVTGEYVIMAVVPDETEEDNEVFYTVSVSGSTTSTLSYSLVSSDGVYTATAGTGHEANFTASQAYDAVSWYLKRPSDTSAVYQRTDSGNGSSTTSKFSYTFASSVSGDYVFRAKGTIGSTGFEESYTVSVSLPVQTVFTPVLTLRYNSKIGAVSMTATANQPIFGADLYVRSPGDGSKYGTKIGWTSGNSNKTTYSLPVRYAFPSTVASGTYKFTLRVYPFNNSGSGDPWGTPYDVSKDVTVQ